MQVNNAINTAVQGFQDAQSRANKAAQDIASQNVQDSTENSVDAADLATSLVELKTAEIDAKANAKVIEAATSVLGSILDISV